MTQQPDAYGAGNTVTESNPGVDLPQHSYYAMEEKQQLFSIQGNAIVKHTQ